MLSSVSIPGFQILTVVPRPGNFPCHSPSYWLDMKHHLKKSFLSIHFDISVHTFLSAQFFLFVTFIHLVKQSVGQLTSELHLKTFDILFNENVECIMLSEL